MPIANYLQLLKHTGKYKFLKSPSLNNQII